jgi:hypothetical protein
MVCCKAGRLYTLVDNKTTVIDTVIAYDCLTKLDFSELLAVRFLLSDVLVPEKEGIRMHSITGTL